MARCFQKASGWQIGSLSTPGLTRVQEQVNYLILTTRLARCQATKNPSEKKPAHLFKHVKHFDPSVF